MDDTSLRELFCAGVRSAIGRSGMSEKEADAFVVDVCKQAAARGTDWEDDEEDEEDTWWNRNRHWALPTAIGAGAFLLGADAGRNGKKDYGYLHNAGRLLWERIQKLLGVPDADAWRSIAGKGV